MSNIREREAEDNYEAENDPSPVSGRVIDDSYAYSETQPGLRNQVPIQRDEDDYEDPVQPPYSNSNEQLEGDEREAIDRSNILKGDRLRHANARSSTGYNEGPDESDLPADVASGDNGRSATRRLS
ncbi:conserved hypothetical protein [Paecilomyces variotii No. 5]|uniref:Histone chaperone domain-containing protein n=1 Tax=Byssochlamys spectabilis (strain No. 5 / NBRC 109023) TaxID=1356009 RepID=V5FF91_BYSSN|nr:conserved hypothetical protein [Paecilomyces variotii No. 5]